MLPQITLRDRGGDLNKRWYLEYYINGQRIRRHISLQYRTLTSRYREAKRLKEQIAKELREWYTGPDRAKDMLISDAVWYALGIKKRKLRPASYPNYLSYTRLFANWIKANNMDMPIVYMSKMIAKRFMEELANYRKLKNKTYNDYLCDLHAIWEILVREGHISFNPFRLEKRPVSRQKKRLMENEVYFAYQRYLRELNYSAYAIARTIMYTGARVKELRYVLIEHFNLTDGLLYIPASISKNNNDRYVALPNDLTHELSYLAEYNGKWHAFSQNFVPGSVPVHKNTLMAQYRRLLAQMPEGYRLGLYQNKHQGAYLWRQKGISIETLQIQYGHSEKAITETYCQSLEFDQVAFKDLREGF